MQNSEQVSVVRVRGEGVRGLGRGHRLDKAFPHLEEFSYWGFINQEDDWSGLWLRMAAGYCFDRLGGHTTKTGTEMATITLQRAALLLTLFIL